MEKIKSCSKPPTRIDRGFTGNEQLWTVTFWGWSPPDHVFWIILTLSDILSGVSGILSDVYSDIPSDMWSGIPADILSEKILIFYLICDLAFQLTFYLKRFWYSIWYVIWHSSWHFIWKDSDILSSICLGCYSSAVISKLALASTQLASIKRQLSCSSKMYQGWEENVPHKARDWDPLGMSWIWYLWPTPDPQILQVYNACFSLPVALSVSRTKTRCYGQQLPVDLHIVEAVRSWHEFLAGPSAIGGLCRFLKNLSMSHVQQAWEGVGADWFGYHKSLSFWYQCLACLNSRMLCWPLLKYYT